MLSGRGWGGEWHGACSGEGCSWEAGCAAPRQTCVRHLALACCCDVWWSDADGLPSLLLPCFQWHAMAWHHPHAAVCVRTRAPLPTWQRRRALGPAYGPQMDEFSMVSGGRGAQTVRLDIGKRRNWRCFGKSTRARGWTSCGLAGTVVGRRACLVHHAAQLDGLAATWSVRTVTLRTCTSRHFPLCTGSAAWDQPLVQNTFAAPPHPCMCTSRPHAAPRSGLAAAGVLQQPAVHPAHPGGHGVLRGAAGPGAAAGAGQPRVPGGGAAGRPPGLRNQVRGEGSQHTLRQQVAGVGWVAFCRTHAQGSPLAARGRMHEPVAGSAHVYAGRSVS